MGVLGTRGQGLENLSGVRGSWAWSPQPPNELQNTITFLRWGFAWAVPYPGIFLACCLPNPSHTRPSPHVVCEDDSELPDLVLDINGHNPEGTGRGTARFPGRQTPSMSPDLPLAQGPSHHVNRPGGGSGLRSLWAVISREAKSMPSSSAIRSRPKMSPCLSRTCRRERQAGRALLEWGKGTLHLHENEGEHFLGGAGHQKEGPTSSSCSSQMNGSRLFGEADRPWDPSFLQHRALSSQPRVFWSLAHSYSGCFAGAALSSGHGSTWPTTPKEL